MASENHSHALALDGIGQKLKALRTEKGLSLRALAAMVDVTPSLISQIEGGKTNPSVSSLYAIAGALQVPMNYFFPQDAATAEQNRLPSTAEIFDQIGARPREVGKSEITQGPHDSPAPVVRRDEQERIHIDGFGGPIIWDRLAPARGTKTELLEQMDFLIITYAPNAASARNLIQHAGFESGYVLEGEFTVYVGFDEHKLFPGDSIAFPSFRPHRVVNSGSTQAKAMWVVVR